VRVTGQAVYVARNIEAHSCNHCCSGKKQWVLHNLSVYL